MKAIVLFSGGLDSTVMLAMALRDGRECYAVSFDYGQRHRVELSAAKNIAAHYQVQHRIITLDPQAFEKSSLVSKDIAPHKDRSAAEIGSGKVPNTYVPARNTLFLSYALALAESFEAQEIYAGPNALDAMPYVDCRPEFYQAFQVLATVATPQGVSGKAPKIVTPLIQWNKKRIIEEGLAIGVPLEMTFSCYDPLISGKPCGSCDACKLRAEGLSLAGL